MILSLFPSLFLFNLLGQFQSYSFRAMASLDGGLRSKYERPKAHRDNVLTASVNVRENTGRTPMLQGIKNTQTRRAYALLSALDAREITLDEFADALRALPSEVLQISATILALITVNEPSDRRLMQARVLCSSLAEVTRSLN
jgi:hypothetical protein